ncbi:MAG: hypothetical protein JWO89_3043, partial [Verrucomicrobiaceae bacterium]|nr:hypothetical protein [Verrucomicrobiaceae bacterium]
MRRPVTFVLLACFSMWSVQSKAATFYWDSNATA